MLRIRRVKLQKLVLKRGEEIQLHTQNINKIKFAKYIIILSLQLLKLSKKTSSSHLRGSPGISKNITSYDKLRTV